RDASSEAFEDRVSSEPHYWPSRGLERGRRASLNVVRSIRSAAVKYRSLKKKSKSSDESASSAADYCEDSATNNLSPSSVSQRQRRYSETDLLDDESRNTSPALEFACGSIDFHELDFINHHNHNNNERNIIDSKNQERLSKLLISEDNNNNNEYITPQMATEHEELLGKQLEQLKEKLTLRTSNGNDHIVQLEAFRHEVDVLTKRKQDLERRLNSIHSERDHLNMSLEESGDKIQLLEQCINDRDARILDMQRELDEMRHANQWLNKRLDNTDNTTTTTTTTTSSTSGTFNGHVQRSSLVRKHSHNNDNSLLQQQQQQQQSNNFAKRRCEIVNVEPTSLYDEIEMCSSSSLSPRGTHLSAAYQQANNASASDAAVCQSITSHEIVVEIYSLLRQFYIELQQRKDTFVNQQQQHGNSHNHHHNNANTNHHNSSNNSSTTDDSGISDLNAIDAKEAVKLMYDTQHWCKLLANIKALLDDMPCSTCQLMIVERHDYEVLQKQHAKLADELKVKNQQLLELTSSTSTQACELDALREQCQLLRHDLETCDMPKEEIVQMAWRTRDEAVRRKNTAEIALAKTRIENMQVSSQLMEVVMQKSELSERIAQFEDDMHYMMQDSVHMKFTWQEYAEQLRRAKQQQASSDSSGRRSGAVGRSSSSSIGATSAIDWPQQLLMKTIGNGPRFNFWSSSKSSSPAKEAPAATASSTQSNSTTTSSTVESKSATATDAKDVPAQHPTINSATTPSPATTKT
ncbi:Bicaudal D-related protein-like protein, partial [Fragariocoptes setiger]